MSVRFAGVSLVLAGALCVGLAGCNSTANLDLAAASPPVKSGRPAAPRSATLVRFTPVKDCRLDPEALGSVAGRAFNATAVAPWIDQGLRGLESPLYAVSDQDNETRPAITIRPSLLKLYVDSVTITKTAVIVLQLDFETPGAAPKQEIYRGQYAGMNWASGADEITTALQLALKDCLRKINESMGAHLPPLKTAPDVPRHEETKSSS